MSTLSPDQEYRVRAESLLLGARHELARAVDPEDPDRPMPLLGAVEGIARRRVSASHLGDPDDAEGVVAGIVAAHVVHQRLLVDRDRDRRALGEAIADTGVLDALWSSELRARLDAARRFADLALAPGPDLDKIGVLLRKVGDELVAASGHLLRVVAPEKGRLAEGWLAALGGPLLSAGRLLSPAAVARVRAGATKASVARRAGISRTTLDRWLGD